MSFERSISSDHTALFINLPLSTPPPPPSPHLRWTIEDQMEQEWKHAFNSFPHPLISDIPSLIHAGDNLIRLTQVTCDRFFARKQACSNKGLAWWNDTCRIVATKVSQAHGPERHCLSMVLRTTIRHAKRDWLEGLITDPSTSIWDLAKW